MSQRRVPMTRALFMTFAVLVFILWTGGALIKSCVANRPDAEYIGP